MLDKHFEPSAVGLVLDTDANGVAERRAAGVEFGQSCIEFAEYGEYGVESFLTVVDGLKSKEGVVLRNTRNVEHGIDLVNLPLTAVDIVGVDGRNVGERFADFIAFDSEISGDGVVKT